MGSCCHLLGAVTNSVQLDFVLLFFYIEIFTFFLGGSLADVIERNAKQNEAMAEGELKQLLIQIAEVLVT